MLTSILITNLLNDNCNEQRFEFCVFMLSLNIYNLIKITSLA